jgi:hypothetical protein
MRTEVDSSTVLVARHDFLMRMFPPLAAIAFLALALAAVLDQPLDWRLSAGLGFGSLFFAAMSVLGSERVTVSRDALAWHRWLHTPRTLKWSEVDEFLERDLDVLVRCSWKGITIPISRSFSDFRLVILEVTARIRGDLLPRVSEKVSLPVRYAFSAITLTRYGVFVVIFSLLSFIAWTRDDLVWASILATASVLLSASFPRCLEVHSDRIVRRHLCWRRAIYFERLDSVKIGSTTIKGAWGVPEGVIADTAIIFTLNEGGCYEFLPRSGVLTVLSVVNAAFDDWQRNRERAMRTDTLDGSLRSP